MIGQRNLQSRVHSMYRWYKLPHFLVFVGERGSGKKTFVKWLAKDIGAQLVDVGTGVEAIREAVGQSYTIDQTAIYLFADGDTMSSASRSALLKATEEPPKKAYYVLTVSDASRVTEALLSRACVFAMDSYSLAELSEFVAEDQEHLDMYVNCCNNGYEIELLKGYGITDFLDFVNLVVDNIAEVEGSNALKMEERIAFKDGDKGYDAKIFLQSFRAECMKRVLNLDDKAERAKYISWIEITSEKIRDMQIQSIDKQHVFDMWVFDIREVAFSAEN